MIKNTKFDNLVNYNTQLTSSSSRHTAAFQSSADPNALSSLTRNIPFVKYIFLPSQQKEEVVE